LGQTVVDLGIKDLDQDFCEESKELDALLESRNPGEGMISVEDWCELGEYLKLSSRELRVAVLMFEGNSRSQIAQRMVRAPGTVRSYTDRIFAKLNVADRLGMVLRITRVHLALSAQRENSAFSH